MNTGLSLVCVTKVALNLKIHIFNLDMWCHVAFLSVLGHSPSTVWASRFTFGFYFDTVIACKIALVLGS